MCKAEEEPVVKCESGSLRLNTPRSCRALARMYLGTEYICLTPLDLRYLARIFHVLQQYLRDFILALLDLLSYVTTALTSIVYKEPMLNASKHIDYHHLCEELVTFV